jgi:hypothetical protein
MRVRVRVRVRVRFNPWVLGCLRYRRGARGAAQPHPLGFLSKSLTLTLTLTRGSLQALHQQARCSMFFFLSSEYH